MDIKDDIWPDDQEQKVTDERLGNREGILQERGEIYGRTVSADI